MYCLNCGYNLKNGESFCPKCGKVVSKQNYANNQNNGYNNYNQMYNSMNYANQNAGYAVPPVKKASNKGKIIAITVVSIVVVLAIIIGIISIAFSNSNKNLESYTVMIYMVGSDLESESQAATNDIYEMIESNVDVSRVNVILYAGGAKTWWIPISNDSKNILKMANTENGLDFISDNTSSDVEDMGEASTFSDFLNYAYTNYPADHYGLICWDHGGGPNLGFGSDELYDGDSLDMDETKQALEDSPFNSDNKLDWIGYDACLMASIEIAKVWSDYADYLIASEETEAGAGWDYSFLQVLNQTTDAQDIGSAIVNSYGTYYQNNGSYLYNPDATLSCMDLSKVDETVSAITDILEKIKNQVDVGDYSLVKYQEPSVKEFGLSSGSSYGLLDLNDFAQSISYELPDEANAIETAVSDLVVCNTANVEKSYGVSFFYPVQYYSDYSESYGISLDYGKLVDDLSQSLLTRSNSSKVSWKLNDVKISSDTATLQLTDDQVDDISQAYYTVLMDKGNGAYTPVMSECKLQPDDNGVLTVSLEPEVVVASSVIDDQTSNVMIYPVSQIEINDERTSYQSVKSRLWNTFEYMPYGDFEDVSITLAIDSKSNVTVKDVNSDNEDVSFNGKSSIDANDWGYIGYYCQRYVPEYSNNIATNYNEWQNDNWSLMTAIPVGQDTQFSVRKTSDDISANFICQIIVKDSKGNSYATNTFKLKNMYDSGSETAKVSTDKGKLSFDIYSDHAELIEYVGDDTTVNIPSTVEGVPVTSIASHAFGSQPSPNSTVTKIVVPDTVTNFDSGSFAYCTVLKKINIPNNVTVIPDDCFFACYKLQSIEIPQGVTYLGRFAFANTALKSLDIPETVSQIGKGVISSDTKLKTITIDGKTESDYFKVVDGFILSNDGKELVAGIVDNTAGKVTIPDGVEIIDDYAFCEIFSEPFPYSIWDAETQTIIDDGDTPAITELVLPSGLKKIGDFAFLGCITLTEINLPDSLEEIGDSAFSSYMFQVGSKIDKITIGPNLKKIKNEAFSGYDVIEFVVDDNNKYYSSVDGKLMNKGGNTEIKVLKDDDE